MSEIKGCMNCGNISCPNNKKRESKGCGRWKTPEQRILELEEKVGMAERTRDRLISIVFPTFASCKEYAAKLKELEAQIEKMKSQYDYAFNQLCKSREILCSILSQYKDRKEIDYSTRECGEKLLKEEVYKK